MPSQPAFILIRFSSSTPFATLTSCSIHQLLWTGGNALVPTFISPGCMGHTLFRVLKVLSTLHPKMPTLYYRCLKQQVKPGPGPFQDVPEHLVSLLSLLCHGKPLLQRGEKQGCSQRLATPQICWYIKPAQLHAFPSCLPENSTRQGQAACHGWAGKTSQPARKTKSVAEYEKHFFWFFSPLHPLGTMGSRPSPLSPAKLCRGCCWRVPRMLLWGPSPCAGFATSVGLFRL